MTRKRYIKLIMGRGESRNRANFLAFWNRTAKGLSYEEAFDQYTNPAPIETKFSFSETEKAIQSVTEQIYKIAIESAIGVSEAARRVRSAILNEVRQDE